MKHSLPSLGLSALLIAGFTAPTFADDHTLKTTEQKASYSLGTDLAKTFQRQGVDIDVDSLVEGMQDVMKNRPLRLTPEEMQASVNEIKQKVLEKQMQARKKEAEANAEKSAAFLAKNKKKDGVKVTSSGLQYEVLTKGKGQSPTEDDYLTAHYEGKLIDGKVFDSSYERGKPIEFQMNNVIAGWREALKMMKPGSKWKIFVPPSLAYGSKGAGNVIGPNETLIFTIELISVSKDKPSHGS